VNSDLLRLIAVTGGTGLTGGTGGTGTDFNSLLHICSAVVRGGATMIQLRLKHADASTLLEAARTLVRELPVPVIVNDRADVALAAGAAGVHLGSDDIPVPAVRRLAPPGFIIGASVGHESEVSNSQLADYVGIGPAFATLTKTDAGSAIGSEGIRKLATMCGKPAVAIGGINATNASLLSSSTACGIAVVGAIFLAPDPEDAARSLRAQIDAWA
jgi:thiamine-phosphate pyrophosphorylase